MHRWFVRFFTFVGAFLFSSIVLNAREEILSFESDIFVRQNGSMRICEVITVRAEGDQIRRGITRSFPTTYSFGSMNAFRYVTGFRVQSVHLDGKSVSYSLKAAENGVRMLIGDASTYLSPGVYAYTITYETDRQLGFFSDYDEMSWNVTGNDSLFPVRSAVARVYLPEKVDLDDVRFIAYTGFFGERGSSYVAERGPGGAIIFRTTRSLDAHEGLTVSVAFPKGVVEEPSHYLRAWWFFRDNFILVWAIFALLLCIAYAVCAYVYVRRLGAGGVVIPRFSPPKGLGPAEVRYLMERGYDSTCFASQIVHMAVAGLFTITQKKKGWLKDEYRIDRADDITPQVSDELSRNLFKGFFPLETKQLVFQKGNQIVVRSRLYLQSFLEQTIGLDNISSNNAIQGGYWILSAALILTPLFIAGFLGRGYMDTILIEQMVFAFAPLAVVGILLAIWLQRALTWYTPQGLMLRNEILGFKLFLKTAETDRLRMAGSPPTKTPELYERFLAYAIALGVEQQWSEQFVPVFERLKDQGVSYVPVWYHGHSFAHGASFHPVQLSSHVSSNLSSVISSSATPPGSTSSFGGGSGGSSGGGGSSGSGGGGGGVGGW